MTTLTQAAAPPKVDVSNDSITCNSVVLASASLKPPLAFSGSASSVAIKVKGTLGGCVDNTNGAVIIDSGSFSGTLTGTSNNCTALLGTNPATGTLTFKWKANKATPILQTSSVVTVTTITGGLLAPGGAFGAANYAQFSLGTSGVTGAFTGGDAGATSSNTNVTSEDAGAFNTMCTNGDGVKSGIKVLHIGLGTVTLS